MKIVRGLHTDDLAIRERFVRSSGPGGQNVNKVATAVELRLDVDASTILPEDVRSRIKSKAGSRLTKDGEVVISASKFRTRERNRSDARRRLANLVREAMQPGRKRKKTSKPRWAEKKRLDDKAKRSERKRMRKPPRID